MEGYYVATPGSHSQPSLQACKKPVSISQVDRPVFSRPALSPGQVRMCKMVAAPRKRQIQKPSSATWTGEPISQPVSGRKRKCSVYMGGRDSPAWAVQYAAGVPSKLGFSGILSGFAEAPLSLPMWFKLVFRIHI